MQFFGAFNIFNFVSFHPILHWRSRTPINYPKIPIGLWIIACLALCLQLSTKKTLGFNNMLEENTFIKKIKGHFKELEFVLCQIY